MASDAEVYLPLTPNEAFKDVNAFTFKWNGRECTGNELHEAVLKNDAEGTSSILKRQSDLLNTRFNYETMTPQGKTQEGSGQAIHLAVSRCSVEVAKVLVAAKADLTAMVTRGGQGHYDVLHACIFSEGRGGAEDMVKYLLDSKAPLAANLNGEMPLHKAFQTGKVGLINILRAERESRGMPDLEDVPPDHKQQTPLELGISMGKMTEDDLAAVAPMTPAALQMFTRHEPRCVRKWLKRCGEQVSAKDLAGHLTMKEICQTLCVSTEAGDALLTALLSEPDVENEGWHPLPIRVSFAPRNRWDAFFFSMGLPRNLISCYTTDNIWKFDAKSFKSPDWHKYFTDRSAGSPIRDVTWQICHLPGLACPEFFSGIADTPSDEDLFIYDNPVVKGVISYVWWECAFRISILQIVMTFWGLSLLIAEQYLNMEVVTALEDADVHTERLLKAHGGHVRHHVMTTGTTKLHAIPLAVSFVGARGIVDLLHELLSFMGYISLGKPRTYFTFSNMMDIVRAVLPIMIFATQQHYLWVFGVLIYWTMILKITNISEKVARAMLPISETAHALGPSVILTLIGFLAFTHAFFIIREGEESLPNLFLLSFSTLLTGSLPADAEGNQLYLFLTYLAVIAFTVFFLNIFIGVISEQYAVAQERVALRYQEVLADECLKFLLRAKRIPVNKYARRVSIPIIVVLMVVVVSFQIKGLYYGELPFDYFATFSAVCFVIMFFLCYQHDEAPWRLSSEAQGHYLWIAVTRDSEAAPELMDAMNEIKSEIQEIKARLNAMSNPASM